MNNYDNLQYVFACISTHSKWVKIFENDFNKISEYFNLSQENKELLEIFFISNSKKLWVSAILMEEKRWRDVLVTINYTSTLVGLDKLKQYWKKYLNSFSIKENIPKSPIIESGAFLNFLIYSNFKPLWKELFKYERVRNSVLSYNFTNHTEIENIEIKYIAQRLSSFNARLNPSFISSSFNFTVTKIIQNLKKGIVNEDFINLPSERISFYKEKLSGFVKCIHLNDFAHSCLLKINDFDNISEWLKNIMSSTKSTKDNIISFLEKMSSIGLIFITEVK